MTESRLLRKIILVTRRFAFLMFLPLIGAASIALYQDSAATVIRFESALVKPVKHSLTRAAALHRDENGIKILFSTHEGYHQGTDPDVTQLVIWDLKQRSAQKHEIAGSAELRSAAFWAEGKKWVFAGALDTALFLYDPALNRIERLSTRIPWGGWIHGLGIWGNTAAASASGVGIAQRNRGILRINLKTDSSKFFEFPQKFRETSHEYSAVDTVDPSGRVWFYSVYPYRAGWLSRGGEFSDRELPFLPGWKVVSWDDWRGARLIVSDTAGQVRSVAIENFETMEPRRVNGEFELDSLVPVDLFHRDEPSKQRLYYDFQLKRFFAFGRAPGEVTDLGVFSVSRPSIALVNGSPDEFPIVWSGSDGEPCTILGLVDRQLLAWRIGRKDYTLLNPGHLSSKTERIPVQNIRPASISAVLPLDGDGIMVTGFPTHGEVVLWQPKGDRVQSLGEPVRNLEGQIDMLVNGRKGIVYGGAYPNAVLFRMEHMQGQDLSKWKSSILWRADASPETKHFQRIESLSAFRGESETVAAVLKSDYSEKKETALVVVKLRNGQAGAVTIRTMRDLNLARIVDVDDTAKSVVRVLGEDNSEQWALLTLNRDNFEVVDRQIMGPRSLGRVELLGQSGNTTYVYDGESVKRMGEGQVVEVGKAFDGNILAFRGHGESVLIIGEGHVSCLRMSEKGEPMQTLPASIVVNPTTRKSVVKAGEKNRIAVWEDLYLVALGDSLYRLSVDSGVINAGRGPEAVCGEKFK